jgi:hypothetical protein
MRLYGGQKLTKPTKPLSVGLDAAGGWPLRFRCELRRDDGLYWTVLVLSTTPPRRTSRVLFGKPRASYLKNLHRGGQPVGARRIVEAAVRQPEQSGEEVADSGWLRQSSIPHDPG